MKNVYRVYSFSEEVRDYCESNQLISHNMFAISVSTAGSIEIDLNLSHHVLRMGDVLFYSPASPVKIGDISADYEAVCIDMLPGLFKELGLQPTGNTMMQLFPFGGAHIVPATEEQTSILLFLLQKLNRLCNDPDSHFHHEEVSRHYLMALLYELVDLCGRQMAAAGVAKFSRKEALRAQFLDWVMRYFKEERSVQFYADKLYVTPKYLSEVIKELTGKTAGELIDGAVILEARVMLSKNGVTAKEVAEALHFSDPSFFGKFFKRYTGMSPSDYKIQYQE